MKILIMRFSSFGDVLQTLSVLGRLGESFPEAEIHFVTRAEFEPLIKQHPRVAKVWTIGKGAGLGDVLRLGRELKAEHFSHIYDAHNNLRTHLLSLVLNGLFAWRVWIGKHKFLRRSIYRFKRFMLFRFHRNLFPKPFSGQFALLEPLKEWNLPVTAPKPPQLFLAAPEAKQTLIPGGWKDFVALAPSAAFALKRWPLEHWKSLVGMFPQNKFVILGGPEDGFVQELADAYPDRVVNLAGKLSLLESARVVEQSAALVANDTGLMHVAEQMGRPCLALMGPAPFGFPSRPATQIFELDLYCRPCSKHGQGPCINPEFQKCLRDISPARVAAGLRRVLHAPLDTPVPR